MKPYTVIFVSVLFLLFSSCKSQKDVSRSVISQTRGESLVTINDSIKTHREALHDSETVAKEEVNSYTLHTVFAPDNNIVSTTETWSNINLKVDLRSRVNELKFEELSYASTIQTNDTTSLTLTERATEKRDSRPVQGVEWFIIIMTLAVVVMGLYMFYFNRRRK